MSERGRPGFTLIEVTLSIVVGIILIAGATLLYNQAKIGAGNARAKAKVLSLQALIEETMALNGGGAPTIGAGLYSLWSQRRPDDYNQSPWGGPAAQGENLGNPIDFHAQGFDGSSTLPGGIAYSQASQPLSAGCMRYLTLVGTATDSCFDPTSGQQVSWRTYGVMAIGADGTGFLFVTGGR